MKRQTGRRKVTHSLYDVNRQFVLSASSHCTSSVVRRVAGSYYRKSYLTLQLTSLGLLGNGAIMPHRERAHKSRLVCTVQYAPDVK